MTSFLYAIFDNVYARTCRFRADARGNVAIIFAFASVAVVVGVGAGIDLSGAYAARQKLSEAATLTCQYSTRPSVVNTQSSNSAANSTNTFQTYLSAVNTFATNSLAAQHLNATNVTPSGSYFTATPGASGPTGGATVMSMSYATSFLKIMHVSTIPVHAHIGCQNPSSAPQNVNGSYVLQEGFETSCASYCFTLPSGQSGALTNPTSNFGSSPTYTGSGGFAFYVIGYCLEVDLVGVINASDPEKTHSAELDCDNATHSAGNSSLSTKVFLAAGNYELRYFYRSRVQESTFDPFYICGWTYNDPAKTDDLSWVNNTNFPSYSSTSAMRTNQMNVYLDSTTATDVPPLHYTNYGTKTEQLAGSNLIDACAYSFNWVERSISVNVTAAGYFWLSFAADGQDDSYGAQLDNIRICNGTCPGTAQDNFPDASQQTTALQSLGTPSAWGPNSYSANTYFSTLCNQSSLTACSDPPRSADTAVLLDPGFYKLTYRYASLATILSAPAVSSSTGCTPTPAASDVTAFRNQTVTVTNPYTTSGGSGGPKGGPKGGGGGAPVTYTAKADVDMIGTFLSYPGQTLTPNIGGPLTTSNPLIDTCFYSTSDPQTHDVDVQIAKPGWYDLSFYAAGTFSSGATSTKYLGGGLDSSLGIKIVPLASPYTLSASTRCPMVPVANPQVGSAQPPSSGSGFTFTATDPFLQGASSPACAPN